MYYFAFKEREMFRNMLSGHYVIHCVIITTTNILRPPTGVWVGKARRELNTGRLLAGDGRVRVDHFAKEVAQKTC